MTGLGLIFARLGLEQYLDSFIIEGFDTWETVLDIQERDLDALNVKLGHRRKLQREISNHRGLLYERSIGSPAAEVPVGVAKSSDGSPTPTAQHERTSTETKRKYRRHPKQDKNAPDRPPSAYVIFSNQIREEVRGHNLSFTDIAKLVGDRWQKLSAEEKEPFESQANTAKERFNAELARYKKTTSYKEYIQYIAEFKVKHSGSTSEGKRPKLDPDPSGGCGSGRSTDVLVEATPKGSIAHTRDISMGSINPTFYQDNIPSPKAGTTAPSPTMTGRSISSRLSPISSSPTTNSPLLRPEPRELRIPPVSALHVPSPTEGFQLRADLPELRSRAGQLSLTSLSPGMNSSALDLAYANRTSAAYPPPLLQHQSSVSSVAHSDSSSTSNAPPVTPADEPWRCPPLDGKAKGSDWPRNYNPLVGNNHIARLGPLPPMQTSERVPDITRDQRTLPFPAASSPHDSKTPFMGHPRYSTPLLSSESSAGSPGEPRDDMRPLLESSENDAATALAVLAYTGR